MSDGEEKRDKGFEEVGAGPMRSFDGSVKRAGRCLKRRLEPRLRGDDKVKGDSNEQEMVWFNCIGICDGGGM